VSNRFTLPTYFYAKAYNEGSDHTVKVFLDDVCITEQNIPASEEQVLKFDDIHNWQEAGHHVVRINWDGKEEAENKWIKIWRLAVNDQMLPVFAFRYLPKETEFIKDNPKLVREKITKPGQTYGWYGDLIHRFSLGNPKEIASGLKDSPHRLSGIVDYEIYTDIEQSSIVKRLKRND
jgi:hypothetical protein|tara:strand:+ start:1296 stop:1826 length:531 start_codon:yes stop_codon:yes gene_type:complete